MRGEIDTQTKKQHDEDHRQRVQLAHRQGGKTQRQADTHGQHNAYRKQDRTGADAQSHDAEQKNQRHQTRPFDAA